VRGRQEPRSSEDVDRTDVLVMSERIFRCPDDPPLQCLLMIRMHLSTPLRHSANACFGPERKRILPRGPRRGRPREGSPMPAVQLRWRHGLRLSDYEPLATEYVLRLQMG
jgi:hypothetical protein